MGRHAPTSSQGDRTRMERSRIRAGWKPALRSQAPRIDWRWVRSASILAGGFGAPASLLARRRATPFWNDRGYEPAGSRRSGAGDGFGAPASLLVGSERQHPCWHADERLPFGRSEAIRCMLKRGARLVVSSILLIRLPCFLPRLAFDFTGVCAIVTVVGSNAPFFRTRHLPEGRCHRSVVRRPSCRDSVVSSTHSLMSHRDVLDT